MITTGIILMALIVLMLAMDVKNNQDIKTILELQNMRIEFLKSRIEQLEKGNKG